MQEFDGAEREQPGLRGPGGAFVDAKLGVAADVGEADRIGPEQDGRRIGADLGCGRGAVLTGVVGEAAARLARGEKLDLEAEDPQLLLDPLHARIAFGAPDQQHVRLAQREGRGSKEKRERARDEREACANAYQRVRMLLARAAYEPFG